MKYLVGIDNGGTYVKTAVFDEWGRQAAVAREPVVNRAPRPGYAERDMEELWMANARTVRDAIAESGIDPRDIAGVSFSGHGKGLYLIGKDKKPLYQGILSTDSRAADYVTRWKESHVCETVFEKSLQTVLACQPVSLLAWLKDHEPEVYQTIGYIFSVKDYIRYRITGEAYGEYTDFSGANLINLKTGAYDRELLACFGLEDLWDCLPPLKASTDICGFVTEEAARCTGIPAGTPVAAGMFDVDACGLASGLVDTAGLCSIAGTWSINEFISREPVVNGSVALNSMYCVPGYYLVEESSPTSAGNLEWAIKNLGLTSGEGSRLGEDNGGVVRREIYELINRQVESVEPEMCQVYFLPFLGGSNVGADARAAWIGLTEYHSRAHMLRAVYEGVAFSHWTHIKRLLKNRTMPDTIRLSGGAVNSDVWLQIFADVMQVPIEVVQGKEQGAQGAAMAAGIAAGIYRDFSDAVSRMVKISKTVMPDKTKKVVYEQKYNTYLSIITALDAVWRDLKGEIK